MAQLGWAGASALGTAAPGTQLCRAATAPAVHGHIGPGLASELRIHQLGKSGAKWLQQGFVFLAKFLLQQDFVLGTEYLLLFLCSGEGGCQHQRASLESSV